MPLNVTVPVPGIRCAIVHYHIFKNGGSTIEAILEREFGDKFATLHGPDADATLLGSDLASFLETHPGVSAVSSHHLRYPKPEIPRVGLFDCCFLRHPLGRLQSYFKFVTQTDPKYRTSRRPNVREFLENLIDAAPHQISDVQVHQLAHAGAFARPANEDDLEKSTAVLRHAAIPGLVEMFDESLVAAEYFLRPAFPGLRLDYYPENVTSNRPAPADERREDLIELWGADLYHKLARLNQMDLELFRRAKSEITQRLNLVPTVEKRLADFQSRCMMLRTQLALAAHWAVAG